MTCRVVLVLRRPLYLGIGKINIGIDQLSFTNLMPTPPSHMVVIHSSQSRQNTLNVMCLQAIENNVGPSGSTESPGD